LEALDRESWLGLSLYFGVVLAWISVLQMLCAARGAVVAVIDYDFHEAIKIALLMDLRSHV
jgi:hypothetical protein